MMEAIQAGLLWVALFVLLFVLPFVVVLRSGRLWAGAVIMWAVMTACGAIGYALDHSKPMFLWASVATGWLGGILVGLPALVIYKTRKRGEAQQSPAGERLKAPEPEAKHHRSRAEHDAPQE